MLDPDHSETLKCLADEDAKFFVVGAYAPAAQDFLRPTMDIDICVMPARGDAAARSFWLSPESVSQRLQRCESARLELRSQIFQAGPCTTTSPE
jgi:hypothetical protein